LLGGVQKNLLQEKPDATTIGAQSSKKFKKLAEREKIS
jgi:hypothetical protein